MLLLLYYFCFTVKKLRLRVVLTHSEKQGLPWGRRQDRILAQAVPPRCLAFPTQSSLNQRDQAEVGQRPGW